LADYVTAAGGDSLNGSTVMAIRGRFFAFDTTGAAAGAALYMGIREGDALDATLPAAQLLATKAPGTTDRYGNWMHRDYWSSDLGGADTAYTYIYPPLQVRARRKIDELNSTLLMFVENPTGAADSWTYGFYIDTLLALP
jgi:hypothetical protein